MSGWASHRPFGYPQWVCLHLMGEDRFVLNLYYQWISSGAMSQCGHSGRHLLITCDAFCYSFQCLAISNFFCCSYEWSKKLLETTLLGCCYAQALQKHPWHWHILNCLSNRYWLSHPGLLPFLLPTMRDYLRKLISTQCFSPYQFNSPFKYWQGESLRSSITSHSFAFNFSMSIILFDYLLIHYFPCFNPIQIFKSITLFI